ncbi:hypothetical protein B0J11DRAFT_569361 [Dendryphion nanum]|uniref:Uncharacterized protein n=1 Tax=Dendryphion nanum TaxID=256645 RepID=A0A9P9IHT2_9PLEO|nr:hypothetical protein B0J11DRAFT_569361 [Dendryphion nanum]
MKLTTLATVIASSLAFAGNTAAYTCYSDGFAWNSAQRLDALALVDGWCNKLGRRYFAGGEQVKECIGSFDNGRNKLQLRIKNGLSGGTFLEPNTCRAQMNPIVNGCARGGYEDNANGWRPRVDPGTGCD